MKYLLATRSHHKAAEIQEILGPEVDVITLEEAGIEWRSDEEGLEPYDSFEENAVSKARYFARRSGLPTIADDSGLEVDALDGRPGVRTKRFAPRDRYPELSQVEANNRHLLDLLKGTPQSERGCRYVCVAVLSLPDEDGFTACRGEAPGRVLEAPSGEGGFGYDPVILEVESGRAFAELSPAEKNARSHRGRAFRALADRLDPS